MAMAIYSSSPPAAVWTTQSASHAAATASLSSTLETDAHSWTSSQTSQSSKQFRGGGLSYLFGNARPSLSSEGMEPSSLSSSGVIRSSAEHLPLWDAADSRACSSSGSSFGKTVSMLQSAPCSHVYAISGRDPAGPGLPPLDPHWRRTSSSYVDSRAPVFRREGFEVNRYLRADAAVLCGQVETSTDLFVQNGGRSSPIDSVFAGFEFGDLPNPAVLTKRSSSEEILADAQERHKMFWNPLVVRAFRVADDAHRGHFRRTGDPYITHCVETAVLLALAGAEPAVVAAGLLHDTLDDANVDETQIRSNFGDDVTDLVVGVSKISQLSQLARDNDIASKTLEADRLRTMFLAMVDVRVVLIKLADRLHNMRTLGVLPQEKQHRIADETLEILVPIANRLGIWNWKAEMEDLCFKFLKPLEYQELATKLAECCRRGVVMSAIEELDQALRSSGIHFEDLCGRSKNLLSIYTKMKKKGRSIDEIHDVRGLRIIVKNERDCYAALDVVHKLWEHVPGKLKDYVRQPKANGYQSLHTVVLGKDLLPLEVQIRTKHMHRHAEFGMAAHWRYKEGDEKHSSFVLQRVEWARWILTWHSEVMDAKLRVSPSQMDLRSSCPFPFHNDDCPHAHLGPPERDDDPLFVIMLKGEKMLVQELPSGCTAGDLLQEKDPKTRGIVPRVNHQAVANAEQKLRMGDVVEMDQEAAAATPRYKPARVYVSVARVAGETNEMSVYREQIRRMYGDGSCKMDARKGFSDMVNKGNSHIAGLT